MTTVTRISPSSTYSQIKPSAPIKNKRGIASTQHLWPQHSTINISLFDMPEKAKEYVKKNINLWQPHTNLKFNYITTHDGDIRISGKKDNSGNWSGIGTEAKQLPIDEPTMHIDLVQTAEMLNQIIRHEFGHAMGLLHEHQHPDHLIQWNKPKLRAQTEKLGVNEEDSNKNIFTTYNSSTTTYSDYDPASVMHYQIEPWLTLDDKGVSFNEDLSEGDKKFMASLYPPTV